MREIGQVKWFNDIKGIGLIRRARGSDLLVHYRMIRGVGYRSLNEGDYVAFCLGKGKNGQHAEDVVVIELGGDQNEDPNS